MVSLSNHEGLAQAAARRFMVRQAHHEALSALFGQALSSDSKVDGSDSKDTLDAVGVDYRDLYVRFLGEPGTSVDAVALDKDTADCLDWRFALISTYLMQVVKAQAFGDL